MLAPLGAAAVGLNPLHALFPADPTHISPYSPSNRAFLIVSYIDVGAVPEMADCEGARSRLTNRDLQQQLYDVRTRRTIDYPAVQRLKMPILTALFDCFCTQHLSQDSQRAQAFRAFVNQMGEPLRRQALFDALHEYGLEQGWSWSWRDWPSGYQDAQSPDVEAFAVQHRERNLFFQYLQWRADQQLAEAQRVAVVGGMPIGLYRDLANGVHPSSAAAWANPGARLAGAHIGAPPDQFNPNGQDWGLAPFSPTALHLQGYASFVEDLRQNMRHAGALRIDHVMGLQRLFLIPEGASPREGVYVRYPLNDLVRLVALQSRKLRCLVIGEDLGTVPAGFRQVMARASIMSCRLLYFERTKRNGLKSLKRYPKNALVAVSTHDLPTLAGIWRGRDLEWRDRLRLYPSPEAQCEAHCSRQADRRRLMAALRRAGLWTERADDPQSLNDLVLAVHQFLARSPSQLLMVQLKDVVGDIEQANLPGTTNQHPNWQRRLAVSLDNLAAMPRLGQLARIFDAEDRTVRKTAQVSST
jgi:4-alpha-glucanotransferase